MFLSREKTEQRYEILRRPKCVVFVRLPVFGEKEQNLRPRELIFPGPCSALCAGQGFIEKAAWARCLDAGPAPRAKLPCCFKMRTGPLWGKGKALPCGGTGLFPCLPNFRMVTYGSVLSIADDGRLKQLRVFKKLCFLCVRRDIGHEQGFVGP